MQTGCFSRHERSCGTLAPDVKNINERNIDDIYLRYLRNGEDALSSDDTVYINMLAWQCPYVAGPAVYKARTMNALYNQDYDYDDFELCNNAGVYKGGHGGLFDEENALLSHMRTKET